MDIISLDDLLSLIHYKKVGGMHHWKVGRIGGSIYIKRKVATYKPEPVVVKVDPQQEMADWHYDRERLAERIERFVGERPQANAHVEAWYNELDQIAENMAQAYSK